MSTNTNNNSRPYIIPSNWVCEDCPHFHRVNNWDYRGACLAQFETDADCAVAVFEDDITPLCSRVSGFGFIARRCEDDNKLHLRGDYGCADDGCVYSRDYCRNNFYQCEECGTWVTDYYNFDTDLQMCDACADTYRREQYRIIGGWHEHKGDFVTVGDSSDPYTVGVEIEVEGYDCDHEYTAHRIDERFPRAFVFENDCSLYDGFEIITQPHTLDAFNALDLEALESLLAYEGYEETDDAETTGLHVHFSTAFLGDTQEERIKTFARLVRFYDSNFNFLCELVDRKDTGHSAPNCNENMPWNESDYYDDYELTEAQVDGSRYVAVNGNRFYRGTFEIRLCDGTIHASKIRAWIDFNIAIMQCLQEHNTTDARAVVPYMSDRAINYFGAF